MPEIRPLRESDLPAVGRLLDARLPNWGGELGFLRSTVFDYPWSDPELGSLVAEAEGGSIVGFIGSQARRLRLDDRELRGVCCSHLVVDPGPAAGAAGALLLGRLLRGPQDLTWSDSASDIVVRIWRAFGGHLDHSRACDWMLVLRPAGWIGSWIGRVARGGQLDRELIPVGAVPFHSVVRRAGDGPGPDITGEPVTSAHIVEHLPALTNRVRLRVDYDVPHLDHLSNVVERRAGALVRRLVRRRGRPIGWYAYIPRRVKAARVLQLTAIDGQADAVLSELVDHARGMGVRVLGGRLEPHLDGPMRRRLAAVGLAREPVIHASDPELQALLATSSSLLTQLDSEWFVT